MAISLFFMVRRRDNGCYIGIPSTQDMAVSLDQADGDKVQGTDFEIQDYKAEDERIGVYSYVTKC